MDWARGFVFASAIMGGSIAYTAYAVGCIFALNGWGLVPALLPVFGLIVIAEARR